MPALVQEWDPVEELDLTRSHSQNLQELFWAVLPQDVPHT